MPEAIIELKLTEQEKRELVESAAADVIRQLASGIGIKAGAPRIGEKWPEQGGIYAGIIRPDDGSSPYHLIVAEGSDGEASGMKWGGYDEDEPGAVSKWDGQTNTLALVESENTHPAAEWAAGLQLAGHSDWYLPAQRELMLCWINTPELFAKEWHLTSTQCSSSLAWTQLFDNGSVNYCLKASEARVRAVRRLPI